MRGRLGRRHGAGAEADPAGGLAGSGEQALGCSAMRQFLEAVMFDRPHVVEPDFVGELNLGHHLPVLVVLIVLVPRLGYLDFIHQTEFHRWLLASCFMSAARLNERRSGRSLLAHRKSGESGTGFPDGSISIPYLVTIAERYQKSTPILNQGGAFAEELALYACAPYVVPYGHKSVHQ